MDFLTGLVTYVVGFFVDLFSGFLLDGILQFLHLNQQ